MNSLRDAAQAALEALDREIDTRRCKASTLRAMIALRAALAQQAEPVEPVDVADRLARHGIPMPGDPK